MRLGRKNKDAESVKGAETVVSDGNIPEAPGKIGVTVGLVDGGVVLALTTVADGSVLQDVVLSVGNARRLAYGLLSITEVE